MQIDIARSVDEALERLAAEGPDLRPVAGATDVMLRLEAGRLQAKKLLSIADLTEWSSVKTAPTYFDVGALTLVADLLGHAELCAELPCAAKAAREFASPQIRNRATLGGNIGNASPAADMVPPLIALGAEVVLRSRAGERALPLEQVFTGPGRTAIRPDELIAAVRIPRRRDVYQAFTKFGHRGANVIAIVNMAMCLQLKDGHIADARIAYGCCGPTPLRGKMVETFLRGQPLDSAVVHGVREAVLADIKPIDDVRGSRRYKELLAVHATEDALQAAVDRARRAA